MVRSEAKGHKTAVHSIQVSSTARRCGGPSAFQTHQFNRLSCSSFTLRPMVPERDGIRAKPRTDETEMERNKVA